LLEKGAIKPDQLQDALFEQKMTKEFLGAVLVKKNYISEIDLLKALASQFNIPVLSAKNLYIDWELVKQFSPSLILQDKCFPIKKDEWSVTIAIINPLDVWAMKKAEDESRGLKTKFVLVSMSDMEDLAKRYNQFMRGNIFDKLK